jgi:rhodanese-related sulfurtransferase
VETSQIIVYGLGAVVLIFYARRWWLMRGVHQYDPLEVSEKLRCSDALLLDVRTVGERRRSSITGSMHIPLHELSRRSNELGRHKAREIICYCQSGNRSLSAAAQLRKSGFNAANMKGGISGWNSRGGA